MDEQKRNRFIILAIGLALFGAGVFGYMHYSNQQSENAETDLATMEQTGKPASPMSAVNNNASGTQPEGAGPAGSTPAPTSAPAATPGAAPAASDSAPATAVPTPAVPVAAQQPTAQPAGVTPPKAPTQPAAAPPAAVATTPPTSAPAKPLTATAPAPTNPPLIASAPPSPAATTPASPPAVAAQPPAETVNPNAIGVEKLKKRFPSMKRDTLVAEAKQAAGRQDPMMPYMGTSPFPLYSKGSAEPEEENKETVKVPPPPPVAKAPKAGSPPHDLVPPPPPSDPSLAGAGGMPGLPLNELPVAPDKPTVADKLRLAAVIGNKVILNVPYAVRAQNKWPATISLAPGEQFESLSVVSVDGDSVTIDEDGERTVKTLASIK